jgi:TolA-binding protein
VKRLLEEANSSFAELTRLLEGVERPQPNPFAKRLVLSRLGRALEQGPKRHWLRPALLGTGALLVAATAAAAGYRYLAEPAPAPAGPVVEMTPAEAAASERTRATPEVTAKEPEAVEPLSPEPSAGPATDEPSAPPAAKPRAGEDPTQVAEAVRALRKSGDPARAQALLDQYLRSNPRGALAEDALALSIEAAAARRDPRAAELARRYLTRYPHGRFRAVAERALSAK